MNSVIMDVKETKHLFQQIEQLELNVFLPDGYGQSLGHIVDLIFCHATNLFWLLIIYIFVGKFCRFFKNI